MSLRLAASAGMVQTVAGMVLGFLSIKITSVYLGPAGLGTLGQLSYFVALTQGVLAAGLHTGLVRRTAELGQDRVARERVISTILRLFLGLGIAVSLGIALASRWLAAQLLRDPQLAFALIVTAGVFVFSLVTMVITACAMGAKDFWTPALINVGSAASSFLLIAALSPRFGLQGGLVATAVLPLATCALAWTLARRQPWWPRRVLSHGFAGREIPGVASFVPMALITAVGTPLLQLVIRDSIIEHSGMTSVGLLQGVMRISDMYLGLASGVVSMYFFPRFSEIRDPAELKREVWRGVLVVIPLVAGASALIYLLRDWLVHLIFAAEFYPMRDLFGWQMAGNTLKMVSLLFGFVLLAKSSAVAMAGVELASLVVWWLLATALIADHGVIGAPQAYTATYALYSLVVVVGALVVVRRMEAVPQPLTP
ncbi:MAG: O-antigen translocase [Rhizobacter sp.]|nr:O-antigen translocase [Rhizobacter sp.]